MERNEEKNKKKLPFKSYILGTDRIPDEVKLPFKSRILGTDKFESSSKPNLVHGTSNLPLKQILGLAGSGILFVAVFMPIIRVPIMGSMNYFQNGKGDGTIIILLAIVSVILVLMEKYKGLWLTGLGSFAVLAFTLVNFQTKMAQARSELQKQLANNPFKSLGDLAMQSIQLQWGWAILVVGATLIIASPAIREEKT